jgi:hypothetical protein
MTAPRLPLTLAAAVVVAAFGALVLLLVPNPGSNAPAAHAATIAPAPVAVAVHAGGTGVSSTLDASTRTPADEAFLADLFEGAATDLPAQQLDDLVAIGHRICDLGQPRAEWLASLTAPGPHAYTADEAGKILDTAHAAYCPESAQTVTVSTPAPASAAPARPSAAPQVTTASAPAAVPSTAAAPSTTVDEPVQEQLPEEQIGGARCGDTDEVIVALDADGTPICG